MPKLFPPLCPENQLPSPSLSPTRFFSSPLRKQNQLTIPRPSPHHQQSLWSINDKFPASSLLVVILLVAFTTYLTIFNLSSLVSIFSHLYASKKRHVVTQMKSDSRPAWKNRAERFEVFRPKHENPEPSEWYVALYAVLNPALVLGWGLRLKLGGRWRWWREKKKEKTTIGKEVEIENSLPWVL